MLDLCLFTLLSTCLCDPATDLRDAIEAEDVEILDDDLILLEDLGL